MGAKKIAYDHDARELIRTGVRKLAKAVRTTLGPRGRNVIIQKSFGSPTVTKDGVTVAKEVELEDAYENMGAQMVKEVASKTSDVAGDGTTTATVLAESIFEEGLRSIASGASPLSIKIGIEKAVDFIKNHLQKMSTPVAGRSDIEKVGTIAANGDTDIGTKISEAMEKVGKDGVITVEEGRGLETAIEWVEGMQFDKGYISPHFVTDAADMECVLEKPYILIHEKKLSTVKDFVPVLEKVAQSGRPLLVIAEDLEGEALATLVVNKLRGVFSCCAVKAPGFGDRRKAMLEDIATLTGGRAIFEDLGVNLDSISLSDLGTCKKVVINKDDTLIIEGAGDKTLIKGRIHQIKSEMDRTTSDYDKEKLQERLAKLAGGVAEIHVGAATEVEMKEKKARVEDALHATRAAVEEGILAGGGVALIRAASHLSNLKVEGDEKLGVEIVRRAVELPMRYIAENAGVDGSIVVSKCKEHANQNYGFNAATLEYGDMVQFGVIDPTKVVRCALQNAASVAILLLTTDALIAEIPEDRPARSAPGAGMGGMGGMGGMDM